MNLRWEAALVWRQAGLKPHRVGTFKVSNDPHFEEKVADVVGLYSVRDNANGGGFDQSQII